MVFVRREPIGVDLPFTQRLHEIRIEALALDRSTAGKCLKHEQLLAWIIERAELRTPRLDAAAPLLTEPRECHDA